MATNKPVKKSDINLISKDYTTRLKGKVDTQDAHGLYPDVDKTKVSGIETGAQVNKIEEVELNGTAFTISGKKASGTIDAVSSTQLTTTLGDYLKEADLSDKLEGLDIIDEDAVQGMIDSKFETIGDVKGTCTKAELATKKTTANKQDIWVVTDDDNHLYMFVGEGVGNAENGFVDLGTHVNLSSYAEKTYVDSAVEGVLKEADFATSEEILAEIAAGVQAATQA